MPPETSPSVLALIARVYGVLPPLDLAGQRQIIRDCEKRLAEPRDRITIRDTMDLTGYGLTKVRTLIIRDKVIASEKDGDKVQSPRRVSRDSVLAYQIGCVVRAHRIGGMR
jgi:hypothetical protein